MSFLSSLVFHSHHLWVLHVQLLLRFQAGKVLMLLAITSWVAFTLPIGFIHPPVVRYFLSSVQVLYFGIFLVSAIQNLYTVFRYFSLGSQVIFLWPKSFLLQSVERELISAPAPIVRAGTSSGSTQLERRYFWPESFLLPVAKRGTGAGIFCRSQSTRGSMRALRGKEGKTIFFTNTNNNKGNKNLKNKLSPPITPISGPCQWT